MIKLERIQELNEMANLPYKPRNLGKAGQRYWKVYVRLIERTELNLLVLGDLCYWEQRKEETQIILETPGNNSKDETMNLKTAQDKINNLRGQLFGGVKKENKKNETANKPSAKTFEEFKLKKAQ